MSRSPASTTTNTSTDSTRHGRQTDVIAPPPGELFSETNDNSVAILLIYATARVLLVGDAEAREEEYMANGPYTRP
jgi:competence protein ComEC